MKLMSLKVFCASYGISRSTAYRLHAKGVLPFVWIGRSVRIRAEAAEAWAESLGNPSNDVG
jgi:excisionase family DNA binding protein